MPPQSGLTVIHTQRDFDPWLGSRGRSGGTVNQFNQQGGGLLILHVFMGGLQCGGVAQK